MKTCAKFQLILMCFLNTILFCEQIKVPDKQITTPIKKKNIIILSSKGGSGHISASQTLTSLLEKEYEISTVFPIETILSEYDPIKKITKKYTAEQFHNKMFQAGWINFVNFYAYYFGPPLIFSKTKKLARNFLELFIKEKPDLIISVIPYLNLAAKNAADKLKIPYILISLDLNIYLWTAGLDKINKENFTMTICDECTKTKIINTIKPSSSEQVKALGTPVKPEFLISRSEKDKELIRKVWGIPQNKFTILLMMGGAGSNSLLKYAKKIAKSELPVHTLVCIGRQSDLENQLLPIIASSKEQTTFTIVPFTNKIADLMSVSNLFITKAGGSSFNEAKTMQLPLLIDETQQTLFWERDTIKYAKDKKIGRTIQNLHNLKSILQEFLNDEYYKKITLAYEQLPKNNFNKEIVEIVHNLCPIQK